MRQVKDQFAKSFIAALASVALSSGAIASENDQPPAQVKIIIGVKTPLQQACYENARNQLANYEALAPCDQALETETLSQRKIAVTHVNRGVIYYNLGEYEAAAQDFSQALQLNIFVRAKTLVNRGLAYEALAFDALAKADYAAALIANPDNATAQRRLKELEKPVYDRTHVPKKIRAGTPKPAVGA